MKTTNPGLLLPLALLIAILHGCAGQPTPTTGTEPGLTVEGRELSEIERLLLEAETGTPLLKAEYTLQAAERLFDRQELLQADQLLDTINPLMLPINREQQYWLLRARIASTQMQPLLTLEWLSRISQPELLTAEMQQLISTLQATNQSLTGDSDRALDALLERSTRINEEQRPDLHNTIWQLLQRMDDDTLAARLKDPQNSYLQQGWYELALINRGDQANIQQTSRALQTWQQLWNLHPAASQLPQPLAQLLEYQAKPAAHIAVLLPQSGKLARPAQAIIEGLLAARFQDQQLGRTTPQLSFYDSENLTDPAEFYRIAGDAGVDLVIGPLDKSKVALLTPLGSVSIPTLALNHSEDGNVTLDLFQFGLRAEDEARQSARRAWQDGHRRALSLTPETDWGQRIQEAFAAEWGQLGGQLIARQTFTGENDFSDRISELLAVKASEQRLQELRRFASDTIEFQARRRQDADVLFLSALASDARQIKPTLAFYYAADLPVYATSHVYSGAPAETRDQDLNGILFCDMPWILDGDNALRASLELYRQDTQSRFGRLYALGADAYRISPYLAQLQAAQGSYLQGESGRLTISSAGEVVRDLDWAEFRDGLAHKLDRRP